MTQFTLETLEQSIAHRAQGGGEDSWTARLYSAGMEKADQKMGEEAVETVIAAVAGDRKALIGESADLLYHWLVVLAVAGVPLADVLCELEARSAQSGIAEKAGRKSP